MSLKTRNKYNHYQKERIKTNANRNGKNDVSRSRGDLLKQYFLKSRFRDSEVIDKQFSNKII